MKKYKLINICPCNECERFRKMDAIRIFDEDINKSKFLIMSLDGKIISNRWYEMKNLLEIPYIDTLDIERMIDEEI